MQTEGLINSAKCLFRDHKHKCSKNEKKKKGSSIADNEALMLLKFTVNHAAACERDIRANIYKSAALEERGAGRNQWT